MKKTLILIFSAASLILTVMLLIATWQYYQTSQYNAAISQADYLQAKEYQGEYGLFAGAYENQEKEAFQDALILYASLEQTPDKALLKDAVFNAGNTYFQQALTLDFERDAEQVFPLVELAKASYRKVLRMDNEYWAAKYNLERALQLLPDAEDTENITIDGFERLVRTVISAENQDELP